MPPSVIHDGRHGQAHPTRFGVLLDGFAADSIPECAANTPTSGPERISYGMSTRIFGADGERGRPLHRGHLASLRLGD